MPAGKPCANQALSGKPFYRAKMLPTATPVVHGNRPAARMPPNFMTALGGRGDVLGPLPRVLCLLSDKTESRGPARPERELKKNLKIRRGLFEKIPKAPAGKPCTRRTLSSRPFYRAKIPSIATPVVHGNRPACRMLQSWMTALGGRGEAQSALLAFGGHETGPAVYHRLFTRTGYAFDRLSFKISLPTFGQDRK